MESDREKEKKGRERKDGGSGLPVPTILRNKRGGFQGKKSIGVGGETKESKKLALTTRRCLAGSVSSTKREKRRCN